MHSRCYSLREAADMLRVSTKTLSRIIKEHRYCASVGRKIIISDADLARLYEVLRCPQTLAISKTLGALVHPRLRSWPTCIRDYRFSKDAAMTQQERGQLLALLAQILAGRAPRANQVAHGLINRVRNPNGVQFPGPQQPRQVNRIAPVGLHPISSTLRDQ